MSYEPQATRPSFFHRPPAGLRVDVTTLPEGVIGTPPLHSNLLSIMLDAKPGAPPHGVDILPAGQEARWDTSMPSHLLRLRLSQRLLRAAAEGAGRNPDHVALRRAQYVYDPHIEHIGLAMKAELDAGYPGGSLYADSLGLALSAHLLQRYGDVVANGDDRRRTLSPRQRTRLFDYIEVHIDEPMTLGELAAVAGLGLSQFKLLFKATTGVSVHRYVVQRRVERARRLLLDGDLPLAQIAAEAGFAHQSHMARCMRQMLGITPSDVVRSRL